MDVYIHMHMYIHMEGKNIDITPKLGGQVLLITMVPRFCVSHTCTDPVSAASVCN